MKYYRSFLSSSMFPSKKSSQPSLSTTRDDHLILLLSQVNFTFKAQLSSLYMHPTDYTFCLFDKNQDFFTSIGSQIMAPHQYWLDNGVKNFSLTTHHHTYNEFLPHTKPQNYLLSTTNILHHSLCHIYIQ